MTHPWYTQLLLGDPDRILVHLERMRTNGIVDVTPNRWQLCLGVLRLWHRNVFRTDTVGTSPGGTVRATWRARLLENRAVRLPFLLAERAVAPLDFTGLRNGPDRLIRHLLGAHHDGNQFVYDLEILAGHGALEQLRDEVAALLAEDGPRARWLRDLAVFEGYHETLAAAVERAIASGPAMTEAEANDPDLTFRGYLTWCARQPSTPADTLAAWRAGRFAFDSGLQVESPAANVDGVTRTTLLAASREQLRALLESGHQIDPAQLEGKTFRGISLGVPAWVERMSWKKFAKSFARDPRTGQLRGWNVRIVQDGLDRPWRPRMRRGRPWTFGHFAVTTERGHVMLDYGAGATRTIDPLRLVRDPLVALRAGSVDLLLGRSDVALGSARLPTPSYFLLEADPSAN